VQAQLDTQRVLHLTVAVNRVVWHVKIFTGMQWTEQGVVVPVGVHTGTVALLKV